MARVKRTEKDGKIDYQAVWMDQTGKEHWSSHHALRRDALDAAKARERGGKPHE